MTQIVVTLDNTADAPLLRRMIENMKGVIKTSLSRPKEEPTKEPTQWMKTLHEIKASIDPDVIDLTDPRTQYIMSR